MAAVGVLFSNAPADIMSHFPSQGSGSGQPDKPGSLDVSAAFDLSDYILLDEAAERSAPSPSPSPAPAIRQPVGNFVGGSSSSRSRSRSRRSEVENERVQEGFRIAFRTQSEVEIMDDGFKWRKYGKKSVKNSPNPRNYFRCSTEGCSVKKRVEREKDDPSFVLTTYEGIHNHATPGVVYYATQDDNTGRFFVAGTQMPPSS